MEIIWPLKITIVIGSAKSIWFKVELIEAIWILDDMRPKIAMPRFTMNSNIQAQIIKQFYIYSFPFKKPSFNLVKTRQKQNKKNLQQYISID